MSMEFLRTIAEQRLPYVVHTPADIDRLRVLRAAQLVTAFIPPSDRAHESRAIRQLAQGRIDHRERPAGLEQGHLGIHRTLSRRCVNRRRQTTPCASIASATRTKPAMFAPST
jgi:hypothetical protein